MPKITDFFKRSNPAQNQDDQPPVQTPPMAVDNVDVSNEVDSLVQMPVIYPQIQEKIKKKMLKSLKKIEKKNKSELKNITFDLNAMQYYEDEEKKQAIEPEIIHLLGLALKWSQNPDYVDIRLNFIDLTWRCDVCYKDNI